MIYNPLNTFYKSIIGAVPENTLIKFRVKGNFNSVTFVLKKDGEQDRFYEMNKFNGYFEIELSFSIGLYFYCFKLDNGSYVALGEDYSSIICENKNYYQLSVYSKNFTTPQWLLGGIIYQIFPDRFNISRHKTIETDRFLHKNLSDTPYFLPNAKGKIENVDFFGGNICGIIEKLPYISSLGVNVIYLNPIFKANSNHRYDTGDYMQIDPLLGDINDFKTLIDKASEFGIKIVLDGVFNHTGDDSLYFNKYGKYDSVGAYQSKNSPYYNWFNFKNYPNDYESWWGITILPSTNKNNEDFINFITGENGVIEYYTSLGIGGWRLDVVDELPGDFVKKIRSAVKKINPQAVVIGEVWEDASNKISYGERREYFLGNELDSVMNYPLKNAIIDFVLSGNEKMLSLVIKEQIDHYPKKCLDVLMNMLSTHDTVRIISALSGININGLTKLEQSKIKLTDEQYLKAVKKVKIASVLQYMLYGVPSVYYGDEIGMQGFLDPLNRKFFDSKNIDEDLLFWYIKLGSIRRQFSCFKDGELTEIYCKNSVFVFKRYNDESEVLIGVNASDSDVELTFSGSLNNLLTNKRAKEKITIGEGEAVILANL